MEMKGMAYRLEVSKKCAIVVNLESSQDELDFGDFKISKLSNTTRTFDRAQEIFGKGKALFGDWLLEWESGLVSGNVEDDLLLLRLFKAGDVSFTRVSFQSPNGETLMLAPYEVISENNRNSDFPSKYEYEDCERFKEFASRIRKSTGWTSQWFKIAQFSFQVGCSKEFHVDVDNSANNRVDRILYFMIALEAVYVPDKGHIRRRLPERVASLIGCNEDDKEMAKELMRGFYDVRSTIAHGDELSQKKRIFVKKNRQKFEAAVRDALRASIERVPAEKKKREAFVKALYDITDKELSDEIIQDFCTIKDLKAREYCLEEMKKKTEANNSKPRERR